MSDKNDAGSHSEIDLTNLESPSADAEVLQTAPKLDSRKLWQSFCSTCAIFIIILVIATVTGFLLVHFTFCVFHRRVRVITHFNVTSLHTTDGIIEEEIIVAPAVGKVGTGPAAIQSCSHHSDYCAHAGNAHLSASSSYNSHYVAHYGFRCDSSWSSARFDADGKTQQWLEISLEKPRRVKSVTFQGAAKYPDNTPTVYELRAWHSKTEKWTRLMSGSHPSSAKRRTHRIAEDNNATYQRFHLAVLQTGWMEKKVSNGFAQMSNVELCWM